MELQAYNILIRLENSRSHLAVCELRVCTKKDYKLFSVFLKDLKKNRKRIQEIADTINSRISQLEDNNNHEYKLHSRKESDIVSSYKYKNVIAVQIEKYFERIYALEEEITVIENTCSKEVPNINIAKSGYMRTRMTNEYINKVRAPKRIEKLSYKKPIQSLQAIKSRFTPPPALRNLE